MLRKLMLIFLFNLLSTSTLWAGLTDWITTAIERGETSDFAASFADSEEVHSILVWDYARYKIDGDGKQQRYYQLVYKILTDDGKAVTRRVHPEGERISVSQFNGWIICGNREITHEDKDDCLKMKLVEANYDAGYYLLNMWLSDDKVEPGCYVAFEIEDRFDPQFFSFPWYLSGEGQPVLESRFEIQCPKPDWKILVQNLPPKAETIALDERTSAWVFHDLEPLPSEEYSPPLSYFRPPVQISYQSPQPSNKFFRDWEAVGRWQYNLWKPQATNDNALRQKAQELGDIPSILKFVQKDIQYAHIDMLYYGGYTPQKATETFHRRYGDCKDKALLTQVMLAQIGVKSFPILCVDKTHHPVQTDFYSPSQFNHCIIGIMDDGAAASPAAIDCPGVGTIIPFDPTHPFLTFGRVPWDLQGTTALLITPDSGELFKFPQESFEANGSFYRIDASVNSEGHLQGKLTATYYGESALEMRAYCHQFGEHEYGQRFQEDERSHSELNRMTISDIQIVDFPGGVDSLQVVESIYSPDFLQNIGPLSMINPHYHKINYNLAFKKIEAERKLPVWLSYPKQYRFATHFSLPPGFVMDEFPDSVLIETDGLRCQMNFEHRATLNEVRVNHVFIREKSEFAPTSYEVLIDFYRQYSDAIRSSNMILKRVN